MAYSEILSVLSSQEKVGFTSLVMVSLRQKSLTIMPWVYIFGAVLLDEQLSQSQQKSAFWTMVLDCKPVLVFVLNVFCIIFLKSVNIWFFYYNLTLIENLRFFLKYQIMINLSETMSALNAIKIDWKYLRYNT